MQGAIAAQARRRRLVGLQFAIGAAALALSGSADAAVRFVETDGLRIAAPGEQRAKSVEVFNGSSRRRTLNLHVLGAPRGEVAITPAMRGVGPGRVARFRVRLKRASRGVDRELLLTSSDGTSARRDLRLGRQAKPVPKLPAKIDFGVIETGSEATIPLAKGSKRVEGVLYASNRHTAKVSFEGGALVLSGHAEPGKYEGKIAGSQVTAEVRHPWYVALLVLAVGIGVGLVVELWLTRWRPLALLRRRLNRLLARVEDQQERINNRLAARHEKAFAPGAARPELWKVPPAYVRDDRRSYFVRAGDDLINDLREARTDSERELFGPDGDKFKALQADAQTFSEFVGDLMDAARIARPALENLSTVAPVAIRDRITQECNGKRTIGDAAMLSAHREDAKALLLAVRRFVALQRRLKLIKELGDEALRTKVAGHMRVLEHTFHGDDDQLESWNTTLTELEAALEALPADGGAGADLAPSDVPQPEQPRPRQRVHEGEGRPTNGLGGRRTLLQQLIEPFRSGIGWLEILVGSISFATIVGVGMSTLYFPEHTWGSTGDYLAIAIWGSTATTALALLRRVMPGALSTAQQGV